MGRSITFSLGKFLIGGPLLAAWRSMNRHYQRTHLLDPKSSVGNVGFGAGKLIVGALRMNVHAT
jgi:hypothetical protein